jgi:mannosyl-glycoprotein endo-beta-N-acetylglucosaminidase
VPVNVTRPLLDAPSVPETATRAAPDPARGEAFSAELTRARSADLVQAERTRLSGGQAADALKDAWQERFGQPPSERTLSILVAHWAHETGRGESMLNYNFGGIKGSGPSGLSAAYKTREGFGENERRITDRFRAYTSASEGARDYVDLLARRYGDAVDNASREDPAGFVRALKAKGYFSGEETSYVKSVTGLANQALAQGFDAIGANREASSADLDVDETSRAATRPRVTPFIAPLGNDALLAQESASVAQSWTDSPPRGSGAVGAENQAWNALLFADEVSRAALLIAARYGGSDPEGQG